MADDQFEERLRAHVVRIAEKPAPLDLERHIIAAVESPSRASVWRTTALMVAFVLVLVALMVLVVGHETRNIFSNISSGLGP